MKSVQHNDGGLLWGLLGPRALCVRYVTPSFLSGRRIRKGPLWRGMAGPVAR